MMTEAHTGASVWVIERGSYSDYGVLGVFSTEANARLIAARINKGGGEKATVSEWPLDPAIADLAAGRKKYSVRMEFDGSVLEPPVRRKDDLWGETYFSVWERSTATAYKGQGSHDVLQGMVWAKTPVHAVKIVNEQRLMRIASGEME
jgi:hypothetical protein